MANKQVNELTTISGAEYGSYLVLYDSDESGDEKLKKLDVENFVNPTALDLYVSESSGSDTNDGSASNPLETLTEAMDRMTNSIHNGGSITLEEGTYTVPEYGFSMNSFNLANIYLVGEAADGVTVSSIQSSSGEAGDWDYVLNVNDTSDISVGNYVAMYSCGTITNAERFEGCWEVIAVDGVNDRITVTVTDAASTSALTGSLTADISVLKTVIDGAAHDILFSVGGGASLYLGDICLAPGTGYSQAFEITNGGLVSVMSDYGFGISGGDSAITCDNGGKFETVSWNDTPVAISSFNAYGLKLDHSSSAVLSLYSRESNLILSGSQDSTGASIYVDNCSSLYIDSNINVFTEEGDGVFVNNCSTVNAGGSDIWCRDIGGDAFTAENNSMIDANCSVLNCDGTGWVAHFGGRIHHYDATNADGSSSTNDGYLYGVV